MNGLFGNFFDLNKDGKMDSVEIAQEAYFVNEVLGKEDVEEATDVYDPSDIEDWDMMDENEREEALENAGLDPDDYRLEVAGIDPIVFDMLDDEEKMEALEEVGLYLDDEELEDLGIVLDELEDLDDEEWEEY